MGAGIAQVCAAAGCKVALQDVQQAFVDKGIARISEFLDKGIAKGKTTPQQKQDLLANVRPVLDLHAAARDADLVIEAIPERLPLKQELFGRLAGICREDTVLATNTSSLSLAGIFAAIPRPERCLGMHFFNPPPLMALLEVVRLAATGEATVAKVVAFARQIGKEPILVKDSPGFASSRLGVALGLEAIRMLEEGVASAEDIDKAMTLGYGHPMGPLRTSDLVGLDVRMAIAEYLQKELDSPTFRVPQLMRDMVARGELGKKSGRGFYAW
jgi:3-hydroxybutyryl-CoA dehydrogenase